MFISVPSQFGYAVLAGFVFAESAGVPLPGETALIAAGLLARDGHLDLPLVIVVAAVAAVLGDNLGYLVGRRGGRAALTASGPLAGHRQRALASGERFFERHGAKTVFLGRWVTGVRLVAAVVAGASEMPWRTFAIYNVLGAITWAAAIAGAAVLFGPVVVGTVYLVGVAIFFAGLGVGAARRMRARRAAQAAAVATAKDESRPRAHA